MTKMESLVRPNRREAPSQVQLATFWVNTLLLGIDIATVREITRIVDITPVPDATETSRGVINLRGEVVTVLDLRVILGFEPIEPTPQSRLMIVQTGDEKIGLMVDRSSDVLTVNPGDMDSLPANMQINDSRYFEGVHKFDRELVVVVNVEAVLESGCEV